MREKDLQKWQKCSSVAGNAGCWSGGGGSPWRTQLWASPPVFLLLMISGHSLNPIQQWLMWAWRVGLGASLKGKMEEKLRNVSSLWSDDGEGGGREGAILPYNLWKALQQMIQIRFMLKCVFTHRDTWAAWPLTFSITFSHIAICWSSKEGVSTSPDVPSRFGNIITFI